jgi:hypothetical protein
MEGQAPQGLRRSCREVGARYQGKVQQIRRRQVRLRWLLVSSTLVLEASTWMFLADISAAGELDLFVNSSLRLESVPPERLPTRLL